MLYCHCERLQGAKSSLREIWRSHDNLTYSEFNQRLLRRYAPRNDR